jgi:competence protein ComEA
MPRISSSERIKQRREAMASDDRRNRLFFLGLIAAFLLVVTVVLVRRWIDSGPVDLNRASLEKLETLPGVGPETAKAITKGRPYQNIDDLQKVKGIGPATVEKLREKVTVGD